MIAISGVSKIYDLDGVKVAALREVSLSVAEGEFIAVTGSSGSGKSTLMNIIGCLDTPSSGVYCLHGEEVGRLPDNRLAEIRNRYIGFIFQSFNLLPKITARENVELPLIYRGISSKERTRLALAALERVGLADRVRHRPTQLSGGQQQRVAIARALVGDPSIILADEPTGNLDSGSGREIISLLHQLHQQGKTVVLITHDPDLALQAQRTVKFHDGMIVREEVKP
jgi:putative ABC transport system ATP-binding protein